jgi:hypothetical protein
MQTGAEGSQLPQRTSSLAQRGLLQLPQLLVQTLRRAVVCPPTVDLPRRTYLQPQMRRSQHPCDGVARIAPAHSLTGRRFGVPAPLREAALLRRRVGLRRGGAWARSSWTLQYGWPGRATGLPQKVNGGSAPSGQTHRALMPRPLQADASAPNDRCPVVPLGDGRGAGASLAF